MLEKQIEQHGNVIAKQCGILHMKFTSLSHAAVPDRIVLAEIPEHLRSEIAKYVRFIEYKAEGKKPTAAQEREHMRLRGMGFAVDVIDNKRDTESVIRGMG